MDFSRMLCVSLESHYVGLRSVVTYQPYIGVLHQKKNLDAMGACRTGVPLHVPMNSFSAPPLHGEFILDDFDNFGQFS